MTKGERVKTLRKTLKLTLEKFAKPLGVKQTAISNIEIGYRGLTEQMLKSICREYDVNEEWLRNGTGEMFVTLTREQEIADFLSELLVAEKDDFRKRFIAAMAKLDVEDWKVIEKISNELAQKKD